MGASFDTWFMGYKRRISESVSGVKNPFYGKTHTLQSRSRMSITRSRLLSEGGLNIASSRRGYKGKYYSTMSHQYFYYDSFYELLRMRMLDADSDVLSWSKKHGIRIPYIINGGQHHYVPDFLIHRKTAVVLEEVKGYEESTRKSLKYMLLKKYCDNNGLTPNILERKDMDKLCLVFFGHSMTVLRRKFKEGTF